jgi:non-heme chloroperoxidase
VTAATPTSPTPGTEAGTPATAPTVADSGRRDARPDTDLTLPPGNEVEVTTDDGARLAATIAGGASTAGPTVVLPHCWTGARAIGVPVARRLIAAGHRVVLYDQRGHGASTVGAEPISVERLGADLAAVLTQLDVHDAVVAGHSMGGMTAMAFACHHPDLLRERVRGLALMATAAHGLAAGRDRFWRMALWHDHVNRLLVRPRVGHAFVRGTFGAHPARAHVDATRALFVTTPPGVRRDCVEAMGAMDLRQALRSVDVPTVVLLGSRDTLIANALTRTIADHIAGAEVVELPGAGHMLPLERPDDVAAAIRRLAVGVPDGELAVAGDRMVG